MAKQPKVTKEQLETAAMPDIFGDENDYSYDEIKGQDFTFSIGSLKLDAFLEGGLRAGVTRMIAPPEHGKTAMALNGAKGWLKKFKKRARIIYFDAEGRLSVKKLDSSGITQDENFKMIKGDKTSTFHLRRNNQYEFIAQTILDCILFNRKQKDADKLHYYFVIDSLDSVITQDGLDKEFGKAVQVGGAATISSLLQKRIAPYVQSDGHHLYLCSQIRANISMGNPNSPKTKAGGGGEAIAHLSNVTGDIQKVYEFLFENPEGKTVADKGKVIGKICTIKFLKTSNDRSYQKIDIPIKFGRVGGVWIEREIVEIAMQYELIGRGKDENGEVKTGGVITFAPNFAAQLKELFKEEEINVELPEKFKKLNDVYKFFEDNQEVTEVVADLFRKTLTLSGEQGEAEDEG